MQKHVKGNIERHLSLMCKVVSEQHDQMKEQCEVIEKQQQVISQLSQIVAELKLELSDQKTQRNNDKTLLENHQHHINEFRRNKNKQELLIAKRVDELSEKVDQFLLDHPITDSLGSSRYLQDSKRYGEYLWTIHNISRRLERLQSGKSKDPVTSESFYTGLPGYKLCLWVYLNGRGKSLGSAMSVYVRVMAGEYDPILKWPIRPQYTFTIFKQNNRSPERKDIVRTRRVTGIKRQRNSIGGIPRPKADERSIIVGFDDFVTYEELQLCGFLCDDKIFLKVEAEVF